MTLELDSWQTVTGVEDSLLHAEVQQEVQALHRLIAKLPTPVLLMDSAGRVMFANKVAVEELALQGTGQYLAELVPEKKTGTKIEKRIAKASASSRPVRMEILWQDGRAFDTTFAPVKDVGVVAWFCDITDLKRLNETKSQWLTTASHDLKNPLALIHGFARLLALEEGLSPEGERCVHGILAGVDKIQALVDNLLDLEQIDAGLRRSHEYSEIGPVVSGVIRDLELRAAEKGQSLTVDVPVQLPPVQIAPLRLEQAVKNLIDNAVKYTQEGGHIQIEAEARDAGVLIRVRDDGPGIPQSAQPRLFERFFRVGTRATVGKEGTGLGLSIVRAIVKDCGGEVSVESEEGRGSTFQFWLPAYKLQVEKSLVSHAGVSRP
jgi:signal transduction histidine kinase